MTTKDLLLTQYKSAHEVLAMVLQDVSDDHLHKDPGGTSGTIATNFAHVIAGEDYVINKMLKNTDIFYNTTYKDKTGFDSAYPDTSDAVATANWMKTAKIDLKVFADYAKVVIENTENYIKNVTDQDLEKEIDIPGMGKKNIAYILSIFVIWNIAAHTGEISAIKGTFGLKGYPF